MKQFSSQTGEREKFKIPKHKETSFAELSNRTETDWAK